MKRRSIVCATGLLLVLAAVVHPAQADDRDDAERAPAPRVQLRTALLYGETAASVGASWHDGPARQAVRGRSIPLALALSAAVPGAGQAYNRQWVKAGLMVAAEVAGILGYVTWRQDGLDGEVAYQAYAHQHWDPVQYASWLNDYKAYLGETGRRDITAPDAVAPQGIDFTQPDSWTAAEVQAVRMFFNEIRAIEQQAVHIETTASFSHQLPYFAEQQYYELIGKYFQFAPGWEDYPAWRIDGEFTDAIDPEQTGEGNTKPNVSPRFWDYARDHAAANDLLRRASRASAFLVMNHLISAIDAAVFSKIYNDRLSARMDVRVDAFGKPQPIATLQLSL